MIEIYAQSYNGQPASADLRCVFGAEGGTFGRGNDNQLPLPDPARHVSRVQGRVRWDGVRYWIANTSDANPLFHNDEEIEAKRERPLAPGDEIRVGLYVLRVREASEAGVVYRPAPPVARSAPGPAPHAPIQQASIDALVGGGSLRDNPFADLIGGQGLPAPAAPDAPLAAPARPASPAAAPINAADPFADLLGGPAQAPVIGNASTGVDLASPAPPPLNTADPFADLLGPPSAARPRSSGETDARAFPQGAIPDDFDPFAAQPSAATTRNTDDPLRALAAGAVDLGGVTQPPPASLVDFVPKETRDPLDALGGTPSLVDPHDAVDPLQMFGGDEDKLLGARAQAIPAGALPMDDGLSMLEGAFTPARSFHDPTAPVAAPVAAPPAAPAPEPPALPKEIEAPVASPARRSAGPAPAAADLDQPMAPTHSPPPVAPAAEMQVLVKAFMDGAGIPEGSLTRELTPEAMRELGLLVYQAVAGAMALIAVRQITKREIGAELTMIVATRNNPLKFLPTPEAAVMQILGPRMPGFMAPVDSMADAFEDLRAHEVGVIAGTRAAFTEVLRRFDPKELEQRLGTGGFLDGVLPGHRDAKLWELFVARFQEVYKDAQDDFDSLYGLAFTQAYEAEVRRARAARRR